MSIEIDSSEEKSNSVKPSSKLEKVTKKTKGISTLIITSGSEESEDENPEDDKELFVNKQNKNKRSLSQMQKPNKKLDSNKNKQKDKAKENEYKKNKKSQETASEILIQELSELEDEDYMPDEEEEGRKSKLQKKVARKAKEKMTQLERQLPQFPAKDEEVGKLIVQAVNEMKSEDLEGRILEYLNKKFRSIDKKNVRNIIRLIEFHAKIKVDKKIIKLEDRDESVISLTKQEALSEMNIEDKQEVFEIPKKGQRGRKRKDSQVVENLIHRIDLETLNEENTQVKKEEEPPKRKRGRPPRQKVQDIIEEISSIQVEVCKKEEYIESETWKSKTESETLKIESDINFKLEESQAEVVQVKRKRGRPSRAKEIEKAIEAKLSPSKVQLKQENSPPKIEEHGIENNIKETESHVLQKIEESEGKDQESLIKDNTKQEEDDKMMEEKVEHQSNEIKPKRRGRKPKHAPQEPGQTSYEKVEEISEERIKNKIEEDLNSPTKKTKRKIGGKTEDSLVDLIIKIHKDDMNENEVQEKKAHPSLEVEEGKQKKKGRKGKSKTEVIIDSEEGISKEKKDELEKMQVYEIIGESPAKSIQKKRKKGHSKNEGPPADKVVQLIEDIQTSKNNEQNITKQKKKEKQDKKKQSDKSQNKPVEIDLTSEGTLSAKKDQDKNDIVANKESFENKNEEKELDKVKPQKHNTNVENNKENLKKIPKEKNVLTLESNKQDKILLEQKLLESLNEDQINEKRDHNKMSPQKVQSLLDELDAPRNKIINLETSEKKSRNDALTTTEKKRRHLLLDDEKMKDKLRANLVKIFEGQRNRLANETKLRGRGGEGIVNNQGQQKQPLVSLNTDSLSITSREENKQNNKLKLIKNQNIIEIEDPTPVKNKLIKEPQKQDGELIDDKTSLEVMNITEENALKVPSTVFTKSTNQDLFKMTPVQYENDKEVQLLSLQSPGGSYLDIDSVSIISSRMDSTIRKNEIKREDTFSFIENKKLDDQLMNIENEQINEMEEEKEKSMIEEYEPTIEKKIKLNQNEDPYNLFSENEENKIKHESFPMIESQDNEFSISKFLN